jgi:hypothetical protein
MATVSCCIDFHDDLLYGLGLMDHLEFLMFRGTDSRRLVRLRSNGIKTHLGTLKKYDDEIGEYE